MKKVFFLSTLFVTGAAFSYKATIGSAAINEKAPTADSIVKGKKSRYIQPHWALTNG